MPTIREVEMLNEAIRNAGEGVARGREQRASIGYRQQLLDQEIARQKAAEAHYGAEEQHFKNMETGQAQANVDKEDKDMFEELTKLNATCALANRGAANKWLSTHPKWGKTGIQLQQPTQKPPPQVGQNSTAQALKLANDWEDQAASETDPVKKQRLLDSAKTLRESVQPMDTITEVTPGTPEEAAQPERGIGPFKTPGTPYKPAVPEIRRTRKVPAGTTPTPTATPTLQPSATRKVPPGTTLDDDTAATYFKQAGGDKAKARHQAIADGYTIPP